MKLKYMEVPVADFKYEKTKGSFSCYVNTKHNIDHAGDRPMDGCYTKSIGRHKANGTMPKMLWSHRPDLLPVGAWHTMEEDVKGLKMSGIILPTTMGADIKICAENKALDSFSIGYVEVDSKYNGDTGVNDLYELDIKEASWVNFACDENSLLQEMKSALRNGELPTKRELQGLLRDSLHLSKKQAELIVNRYDDTPIETQTKDIFDLMAKLP